MQAQFDANTFAQFQSEAQVIARLQHPNIVPVLEFGLAEEDRAPFLVMEYSPQGSLRQRYPRGSRVVLQEAVGYIKQIANALQYAHSNRVIHRDIKPENMLFGANGQVLLSDFGIALVLQSSHYQNSRDIVGTIAYMSPEQLQGKVTFASDQYALGITFYEWLCGELPFQGGFAQVGSQHLHMPSPSLLGKVPGLPPGVDQVIQKTLAKDAGQRFANVQDFAQALEIAARGGDPSGLIQRSFASSIIIPRTESGPSMITGMQGQQMQLSAPSAPYPPQMTTSGFQQPYPPQITNSTPPFQTGQFTPPFQTQPPPMKKKRGRFYLVVTLLLVILVVGVGAWGYFRGNGTSNNNHPQIVNGQSTQPTATTSGSQSNLTATSTSQVTPDVTPTALAADGTITVNKLLTCSTCIGGNDPIHFTVDTITIDNANGRTVWSVTLRNVSGNAYYVYNQSITLQISSGTTQPVQATGVSLPNMNAGDKATIQFIFAFVPYKGVQYAFSAHLSDNGGDNMPFDVANFNF